MQTGERQIGLMKVYTELAMGDGRQNCEDKK
jgi:hypothetical protein